MFTSTTRPRSMAGWAQVVRDAGITDYDAARAWLRDEHGFPSSYAMMVASIATMEGGFADYGDEAAMLDAMYSGPKEHLRPLFDTLCEKAAGLGDDVELVVCKTQASFRRNFQFAILRPATRTQLEVGLALPPGTEVGERLQKAPNRDPDDRVQYRVRIGSEGEIDRELVGWLKAAYKYSAKKRGQK